MLPKVNSFRRRVKLKIRLTNLPRGIAVIKRAGCFATSQVPE